MHVGKRIRERRQDLHMSVDELAKQLGKNRATIYRYEKGDIEHLPIDILEPLAIALNTTPQYLMGWETKTDPRANERDKLDPFVNDAYIKQIRMFDKEFGRIVFTEEELAQIFSYIRFILSQRKNNKEE